MMKVILNTLSGVVLGSIIVVGIITFQGDLKFFFGSAMIGVLIWLSSLIVTQKTDVKVDDILKRVKRIEERLDGLHKK